MTDLKPCPFCGGKPEIVKDRRFPGNSQGIDAWHVTCPNSDCVIYAVDNKYFRRKHKAVAAWNRRNVEHGHWELTTQDDGYGEYQLYKCDKCGGFTARQRNYCSNCGAKMEITNG